MSFKEGANPPLKLSKTLNCTNCNVQFFIRDLALKASKYPILLHCGHSVCEFCLQQCLKRTKSISCRECNFTSSSASEEIASECFPFSIYELGSLVAIQIYKHEKDKRLAMLTRNSDNFNYSLKKTQPNLQVDQSVCEECSLAASWYCDNCKSNFCDICWSKVHGLAKSLMKHCKIALCAVENLRNGLKCTKHVKQDLEFFCTGCSVAICSHCVILQHQGEGHYPITLKEKNIEMISKVKSAAEEAEVIKKRMKQTLEKIKLTQDSGDLPDRRFILDFKNQIMKNFSRIHGLIQLEEERYLKELREATNEREDRLRALSEQLKTQMKNVESLLSQYECAVKMPESIDLTYLYRQLKEVQNLPCYLISQKPDDVKEPKITFDKKFIDLIHTYCSMDVPSRETFQLLSSADLPEDYAVEPLNNLDPYEELKPVPKTCLESSASDVDTLSNSSSREVARASDAPSPKAPLPQKVFYEKRNYSVRVTYIKNPGEFYVTLNSQRSKQLAIEKKAYELASRSSVWPDSPGKDEIYLVKYDVDKKWYRGRVVERSRRIIEGEECVVIYYLDYGNTEVVPLSRLRWITTDMMEEPPLAIKCKLFDCVPKNGKWCAESTKTMEKILNEYTATMSVMKVHQDFLEVDLSVIYPEGQIGRDIVSVRDALLFLEFSSFVNGTKIPQSATSVKYMHQCLPAVGEAFDAIITHVNSPSDFYVQRTRQDTSYLFKLTRDLQNYYEENAHKGFIYNPSVGMPCAALFSADHKWYRAKIIDMPGRKTVTVFYVDYGNAETVPPTQIRKLNECFLRRPPLALNCALAGIYPTDVEWHVQTKFYMEKCVLARDCVVQVHGRPKAKQKLKVFFYKRVNNKEICVNTLFVDMGYAAKCSLNSSWIAKAHEQEEGIKENIASKEEKIKSNIALDEEQPASDTENDSLKKSPVFKEQKKKKLSAKKLRELHENEKQSFDRMLPAEDSDNEVDEYDNIFKVKVNVLSAESPSSVYVTFPVLLEELKKLQSKMNEYYKDSASGEGKGWAAGNVCAVYHSGKSSWYRGSVLKVLGNDEVEVFLKDVAEVVREPASSLRELEPSFMKFASCAVKCHLAEIYPPGERWPSVSSEYLLNELDNYKEVYMTKKGQIENKSLPIELWVKRIVTRGALEPTAKEWITLNKLLVSQGLAIPKQSKLCCAATSSADDQPHFESPSPAEEQVSQTPARDAPLAARWLPPEPLKRTHFVGIPTYVDSNAHIYIHDVELDEEKLMMMCDSLLKEYGDSKGTAEDDSWSPGQACIARYHMDNSWYRGLIVRTHENGSYDVLFVDYGNTETCQASDLRKRVKMQEVPVIAHKFILDGVLPVSEDGKWPVSVLEILHSLVVDKKCEVIVLKTPSDPSEASIISLKIIEDGIDIGSFLVDQGLALATSLLAAEIECNPSAPDVSSPEGDKDKDSTLECAKSDGNSSTMGAPYSSLTIPSDCNKFLITVTTLISENEFFGNIVDEDSLSPVLRNVLNKFEDLQEQLAKEGDSQPLVENIVKGEPCCCLCPENNKWCRGEIRSVRTREESVCIFYVDHGSKGLVDKHLLHMCRKEWLHLPKMAVKFKLANVKKCPTVSKSIYMKTLTDHLKESVLLAQVMRDQEVLEVRLLAEDNGPLVYQDMIDKNLMKFI